MRSHLDPAITELPRQQLSIWPTPLHRAGSLSSLLGLELLLKREDVGLLALAGNKVRKLEYIFGPIVEGACDTVITTGATQSNHARLTAGAAAHLGLDCHLVLRGEPEETPTGNLLLDRLLGAAIHYVPANDYDLADETMASLKERLAEEGRAPFVIPLGGTPFESIVAFVDCAREIAEQSERLGGHPDAIVVAAGTATTMVGLWIGAQRLMPETNVIGVTVAVDLDTARQRVDTLIGLAEERLGIVVPGRPTILDSYRGQYGVSTDAAREAIRLMARHEGVFLDSTYTGKAFGGLLHERREGILADARRVVFLHSGGVPELFARPPASLGLPEIGTTP